MLTHDKVYALRLLPGQDLRQSVRQFVKDHHIQAGWITTCVGSLTAYHIRFANASEGSRGAGHYEILSLSGTLCLDGCHLHICVADETGKTTDGHLLDGCMIYTTAEIILAGSDEYVFTREPDATTRCNELVIQQKRFNAFG